MNSDAFSFGREQAERQISDFLVSRNFEIHTVSFPSVSSLIGGYAAPA